MLFDDVDLGAPLPEPPPMSAGQRLSRRQRQAIDDGRHPLTKLPIVKPLDGRTCGSCLNRIHPGRFPKCDLTKITRGLATDCRAWWPACTSWEASGRL